ncbi:MAG: V-type ATP synthase subunit I [Aerococcaceae bacterium]|nr:V-type ATP synthase subunit I [Aerococcaceae bacterium]
MAISPMKKVVILAEKERLETLLVSLQQLQQLEIIDLFTQEAWQQYARQHDIVLDELARRRAQLTHTLNHYKQYVPKPTLWQTLTTDKPSISFEQLQQEGQQFAENEVVEQATAQKERLKWLGETIEQLTQEHQQLAKWQSVELIPQQLTQFEWIRAVMGTVPNTTEDPYIKFVREHPDLSHELLFMNETEYGLLVFLKEDVWSELLAQEFKPFEYVHDILPKERLVELEQQIQAFKEEQQQLLADLSQVEPLVSQLQLQSDYVGTLYERERVKANIGSFDYLIAIEGWIEASNVQALAQALQTEKVVLRLYDVDEQDAENVPVQLRNHALIEPFEVVTEMYALPKYNELDPTPYLMPFYLTFFGMMVADLGYGVLLALLTFFALKKLKLSQSMNKNMRLFHFIGWSTAAWGLIYGSWFGFSLPFKLIDMNTSVTSVLILSVFFGFLQLLVAFFLNAKLQWKRREYVAAYSSSIAWILIFIGTFLYVVGTFVPQFAMLQSPSKWLIILNAVGIVAATIFETKSVAGLGIGLYNLYGASSYVGDLVSYTRLMALGLSGGSIAVAFNMLVEMLPTVGRFTIGIVLFVALHLLNFFLSMLGGYVHGARLIFVEFFGKFYEGGGKAFKPLKAQEEYYTITNHWEEK